MSSSDNRAALAGEKNIKYPLLTIIRHPETSANVAHVLQGSTDSPLSVHGQAQLRALCEAVKKAHRSTLSSDSSTTSPIFDRERRPTHILASPLGRALQLAGALEEALCDTPLKDKSILEVRPDLAERGFGALEGTRKGEHVSGFPRSCGPREGAEVWARRVRKEAQYIFSLLQSQTEANQLEENAANFASASGKCGFPHIVVVTHGLWIGTFCSLFVPDRLSFMGNTAILSLCAAPRPANPLVVAAASEKDGMSQSGPPRLSMINAGDTSHLVGLKRQRGGIGSSASDKRQRTLQTMWSVKGKSKTDTP